MGAHSRRRTPLLAVAALAVALFAGVLLWPAEAQQTATTYVAEESCVLDARSRCSKTHGLGVAPVVFVQEKAGGQNATVDSVTSTSYRLRWLWHDGRAFPQGTVIRYSVRLEAPTTSPTPTATPTTPTVTPTATPTATPTVTPTSTPTTTTSPVKTCTNPNFTTTNGPGDHNGAETTYPDHTNRQKVYGVHNDMWNNDNGTYTLNACDYDNWYELATQPNTTDGSVKTYPKVKRDYCPGWVTGCDMDESIPDVQMPLSRIESARFAHNTVKVPGMIWNVAFDVWINNALDNELMIWTENHGQTPAGNRLQDTTIGGKPYQVWKTGSSTSQGGIFTYVSTTPQTSGTMPLNLFFADLKTRGWLKPKAGQSTDTTWQLNYGVEIVDTNNTQHRFNFTDFHITEN